MDRIFVRPPDDCRSPAFPALGRRFNGRTGDVICPCCTSRKAAFNRRGNGVVGVWRADWILATSQLGKNENSRRMADRIPDPRLENVGTSRLAWNPGRTIPAPFCSAPEDGNRLDFNPASVASRYSAIRAPRAIDSVGISGHLFNLLGGIAAGILERSEEANKRLAVRPAQIAIFSFRHSTHPRLRPANGFGNLRLGKPVVLNFGKNRLPVHAPIIAIAIILVNAFAIALQNTIALWKH